MNGVRAGNNDGMGGPHLDLEEVAAYVDGRLPEERRPELESHLADCEACREEVVGVSRAVRETDRRSGRRWTPLALAAGIAGLLVVGALLQDGGSPDAAVFRDGPGSLQEEGVPRISVVRPEDGATVSRDSLRFVWRAAGPEAFYRYTLTDASGDVLWRAETSDTTLTLHREVALRSGAYYYWYVDTLLETGASATTDVVGFRVGPGSP